MLPDDLQTAGLLFRPVAIEDADAIFDTYARDEEVVRYLIWQPHRSRDETQAISSAALRPHRGSSGPICCSAARTMSSVARSRCASAPRIDSIAATCSRADGESMA